VQERLGPVFAGEEFDYAVCVLCAIEQLFVGRSLIQANDLNRGFAAEHTTRGRFESRRCRLSAAAPHDEHDEHRSKHCVSLLASRLVARAINASLVFVGECRDEKK
jgi:hypothetical protein